MKTDERSSTFESKRLRLRWALAGAHLMATPLIAVLLVTTSSAGTNLVFRWPPYPQSSARLVKPRPYREGNRHGLDSIWQASHVPNTVEEIRDLEEAIAQTYSDEEEDEDEYIWHRPSIGSSTKERSRSRSRPPGSKAPSPNPSNFSSDDQDDTNETRQDFDTIFGFSTPILAEILAPARELCYQKFELIVDDLAFVGHPVCQAHDNVWRFDNISVPPSTSKSDNRSPERGRTLLPSSSAQNPDVPEVDLDQSPPNAHVRKTRPTGADKLDHVRFFHLVLVVDRPDPASYHTTDLSKLLHPYYSQVAFKLTAGLLHEEARAAYVSKHTTWLVEQAESAQTRGLYYSDFAEEATQANALAKAIRQVYSAIREDTTVRIAINHILIDIQLPPGTRDEWAAAEEENVWDEQFDDERFDETAYGWAPRLRPWNALLMLEDQSSEITGYVKSPPVTATTFDSQRGDSESEANDSVLEEQRALEEVRVRFYSTLSPTLSLSEIANLLDLDLYLDVFPMARSLIYTRKAKLIDPVRENLKNIYFPTATWTEESSVYFKEFSRRFPKLPPLPNLLASLSVSPVPFASILPPSGKERQSYLDALIWMLKRGLLEMMQVRVRIFVPTDLKRAVWEARVGKAKQRKSSIDTFDLTSADDPAIDIAETQNGKRSSLQLKTRTRLLSDELNSSPLIQHASSEDDERETSDDREDLSTESADFTPSIIRDPGRATMLERRWLDAMIQGKDERLADLFHRLLPYFDGKTTPDEILYRTEVKRRELREVLHRFDPYVMTVLHP